MGAIEAGPIWWVDATLELTIVQLEQRENIGGTQRFIWFPYHKRAGWVFNEKWMQVPSRTQMDKMSWGYSMKDWVEHAISDHVEEADQEVFKRVLFLNEKVEEEHGWWIPPGFTRISDRPYSNAEDRSVLVAAGNAVWWLSARRGFSPVGDHEALRNRDVTKGTPYNWWWVRVCEILGLDKG